AATRRPARDRHRDADRGFAVELGEDLASAIEVARFERDLGREGAGAIALAQLEGLGEGLPRPLLVARAMRRAREEHGAERATSDAHLERGERCTRLVEAPLVDERVRAREATEESIEGRGALHVGVASGLGEAADERRARAPRTFER